MSSPDAIVVGAGICGAAVAHCLAERGREVLVVERAGIAAGSTSRGEGNVLACDKPPGPERELTLVGRGLWESLGARFPAGRVARTGSLLLSRAGEGPGAAGGGRCESDALDPALGTVLGAGATAALEPALAAGVRAVHEPGDLMVDAPGMARALLDGIELRLGAQVIAVGGGRSAPGGAGVELDSGERLTARDVIVCAGAWSGPLTGLPVQPRKGQLVALAAPRGLIRHKLIEAAYLDAVATDDAELAVASVIEQTLDGDEVLVGSSRQRVGFDESVDDAVTQAMLERAAGWMPALRELPINRAWAGLRPWLPDHLPAIGPLGETGLWTSTGHEGSGVCLGPVSGQLLAQLICDEDPLADPAPFDPRRFTTGAR